MDINEKIKELRKQLLTGDDVDAAMVATHALGIAGTYADAHARAVGVFADLMDKLSHMGDVQLTPEKVIDMVGESTAAVKHVDARPVLVVAKRYEDAYRVWMRIYGNPATHAFRYVAHAENLYGMARGTVVLIADSAPQRDDYVSLLNMCHLREYLVLYAGTGC